MFVSSTQRLMVIQIERLGDAVGKMLNSNDRQRTCGMHGSGFEPMSYCSLENLLPK